MNSRSAARKYRASMGDVTRDNIIDALDKAGYTVVEFLAYGNEKAVETLIAQLELQDRVKRARGFTFANNQHRLVFVNEDLTEDEQMIVLAHELGHIALGHMTRANIIGNDVKEEYEANEFVHYLLHQSGWNKVVSAIRKHKKVSIVIALSVIAAAIVIAVAINIYNAKTYYGEYYITATGTKYHLKDCSYVVGKDNLKRLSVEEYESGKYEPCEKCILKE